MTSLRNTLKPGLAAQTDSRPDLARNWFILISIAILVSYVYAFLEWSFFITQPSYASVSTNLIIKLTILLFSGFIISAIFGFILIALFLIFRFIPIAKIQVIGINAGRLVLAFLLACVALLLIDNFTYTIFTFGIITASGFWRAAYGVLFVFLVYLGFRECSPLVRPLNLTDYKKKYWQILTAFGLIVISIMSILTTYLKEPAKAAAQTPILPGQYSLRPNIILIGSDGVNASHMSLYGYPRETTPWLDSLAQSALVTENAFSNATTSTASDTSILTGKYPTTTRVMYPPDFLQGENSTQHLPAILKQMGYYNIEIGIPHYVDAYTVNFKEGFDLVNGRTVQNYPTLYLGWKISGDYPAYFIGVTFERIFSRLKHIFFIETIDNPYREVTTGYGMMMTDQERIDQLITLLGNTDQPLFAHIHLMGTHGSTYSPKNPFFSDGKVQNEPFDKNFYDDAIRDFDSYLNQLFTYLENSGVLNNTIVIIYSDHGQDYTIDRLPLVFIFPNDEFAGVIKTNTQNLDIAPTLLDYLNYPIPEWMEGESLLSLDLNPQRPIFSSGVNPSLFTALELNNQIDQTQLASPWYQFGTVRMNLCDQYYQVILMNNIWIEGQIPGHTSPCDPSTLPTKTEARTMILDHLKTHGFDISTLQKDTANQ